MENGLHTILLFEDDPNDVLLFKRALRKNGISNPVQSVLDGIEGIRYLKGEGQYNNRATFPFPRLILLDLKMPRLSGLEVLKWLKENPKYEVIPTIVLSSSKVATDIRKAYELGAHSYFVKPGSFDELQTMTKALCDYWLLSEKPEPIAGEET